MSETGKVRGYRLLVTITLLNSMLVVWLIYCFYSTTDYIVDQELSINKMQLEISFLQARVNQSKSVDFASEQAQELTDGFLLVGASQSEKLTGIVFSGRIINTKSVAMTNSDFQLSVSNKTKTFQVKRIAPGGSSAFSVYVPDLAAENARIAEISFMTGYYNYSTQ